MICTYIKMNNNGKKFNISSHLCCVFGKMLNSGLCVSNDEKYKN